MKMKKLFLTILVVALLLSTTVVRAATAEGTLSADKPEYKKGDTVTLTLTMAKTSNTNGILKYNKKQFKL